MKTSWLFRLYFLFWFIYFGVIWFNAIQVGPDGWVAAYIPHWADGAAHLSYMSSVAYRQHFPEFHPLFINHPFSYSFVADYLGGLLVKLGLSLPRAYNLFGFLLSLILVQTLWKFIFSLLKSSGKTFIATSLFFFAGGMGWKYLLFAPPTNPDNYFFSLLTQVKDTDIVWLNTIVGELIPQRSFLLGLPLGCLLLYTFIHRFIFNHPISRLKLAISGVILGLMPIIHPHTAMILYSSLAIYGGYRLIGFKTTRPQILLDLLSLFIPAFLVGIFVSLKFIFPAVTDSFFSYYPGWLASKTQTHWILFWFDNWGIFLPLALLGTLKAKPSLRLILVPFWLWFILANLFIFQPYDWDNSKIFTWVYLLFCLPVVNVITQVLDRRFSSKILAGIVVLSLTFSGGFDALRLLDTKTYSLPLLNREELSLADYLVKHTKDSDVILTTTTHRNWVSIATGRQILCGYLGWMWTYGIEANSRVGDIKAIYAGAAQAENLIKHYGITHIVIGPEERSEYVVNQDYFTDNYSVFYETPTTTIYEIN